MSGKKTPSGRHKVVPHDPVNLVDGIPDSAPRKPLWAYLALAGVFLLWMAFLVYSHLGG